LAAVNTTTTVTTTTSTRLGQQLVVDSQANTVSVGDFVTDVSIQPYIANRIISFIAYNMRPNQRMHIFFDSVLVDEYCAPGAPGDITIYNNSAAIDTSDPNSVQKTGTWGDAIYSDSQGRVFGQFNIPAGMFKTGDRVLEITDVTNLAQGNDAMTTVSSAIFTASNLNVTKKNVTLTTVNPELRVVPVVNTVVSVNTVVTAQTLPDYYNVTAYWTEPIAQGLTINTPNGEAGIYCTAIDIYFKQKAQVSNNGVTMYLCEINNGYPDGNNILPFSTVHLDYSQISISDDASVPTKFTFEAPVFLNNNKEYAFIVKPDSNDPDYFVYAANLGDIDISTGIQVYSQPVVGTAFYGATMQEWTALQTEYIKFKLYRASFSQTQGDAYFNNANTDYVTIYNVAYQNTSAGMLSGDYVYQSTNSATNTVNTSVYGMLRYYDNVKEVLYIENSTGNFTGNTFVQIHRFANDSVSTPNSSTLIAYANTGSLYNPIVDAVVPQFATLTPSGTSLQFNYSGTSNAYTLDTQEFKVNPGYEVELFDQERIVASKSNEVASMSGQKSFTMHSKLKSDSEFVSPAIDVVRDQQLVIANQIDPIQFVYEEFYNTGVSKSKYVSQIITLAENQDAQDLQVMLTAHRPPGTDIQVWVKFINKEDTQPITQKTWTPLRNISYDLYGDPSNPDDFREYTYAVPEFFSMIPTTGTVTVSNSSANITGTSTLFGTDVKVGYYINMFPNSSFSDTSKQIIAIANTTQLTLESPFIGNYTSQPYYIVPPVTTAWSSINTVTQLSGTVTTSTTNNVITGSSTNFTGELLSSSIISINGDKQKVVAIANATSLTVGTPWSSAVSGANAYNVTPAGLTYLNKPNSLYNTFKQFQVKIVLQSNDTSKVPILDDLRCLALQL